MTIHQEFLDFRRKLPTPYMEKLHFRVGTAQAGDPDRAVLSKEDLERAEKEGKEKAGGRSREVAEEVRRTTKGHPRVALPVFTF